MFLLVFLLGDVFFGLFFETVFPIVFCRVSEWFSCEVSICYVWRSHFCAECLFVCIIVLDMSRLEILLFLWISPILIVNISVFLISFFPHWSLLPSPLSLWSLYFFLWFSFCPSPFFCLGPIRFSYFVHMLLKRLSLCVIIGVFLSFLWDFLLNEWSRGASPRGDVVGFFALVYRKI